jgi:hypothetical protein
MDDDIVIAFHSNDTLETITKKIEPDIRIVQLSELMGGAFPEANACYVTTRSLLGTHVGTYQKSSFLVP